MEFRIQLDPGVADAERRAIYSRIPPEFKATYLERLSPALAAMVCTQAVESDRVLEAV